MGAGVTALNFFDDFKVMRSSTISSSGSLCFFVVMTLVFENRHSDCACDNTGIASTRWS